MARAYTLTVLIFLILAGCLFLAGGDLSWPIAWAALGIYLLSKLLGLLFIEPGLIIERAAPGPNVDRPDRVIAAIGYLGLYPGTLIAAGLDAGRFGPAIQIPLTIQMIALFIFTLGYAFATWASLTNPFFTTFVRIQEDRQHAVISSGAYALVRHPAYAGALIAHLALPFALGSIWALVPAGLGTIFFVIRTAREDRILHDHLAGYPAYQNKVRWRLVPGIW